MSNQMQLQLAAPNKLHCDKPFHMINVPGSEGDVGVMQGHAPMALSIDTGAVNAFSDDKTVAERWFVVGGYAEVTAERCTIMALEVHDIASFSRPEIESEVLKHKNQKGLSDEETRELHIAEAKLIAIDAEF